MKVRLLLSLAALMLFLPVVSSNTQVNITRDGCGREKLCLEYPTTCDPSENANCLFFSSDLVNSSSTNGTELSFELSGSSEGYIAMGLTMNVSQGMTMLFVCAQNNGSFVFHTARRNNSVPGDEPMLTNRTVTQVRGEVNGNNIRCEFNVPGLNFTNIHYIVLLGTGSVTNGSLGNFTVQLTRGPLNLTEPSSGSSNPTSPPPTTTAPPTTTPTPPLTITRDGCGKEKLCLEYPTSCDPSKSASCLFFSSDLVNSSSTNGTELSFELSGSSEGYIAMGLTMNVSQGMTMLFVCAQNNGSFVFHTARRNNSVPGDEPMLTNRTVTQVRGEVNGNNIRCEFNVPGLNFTNIHYIVLLGTGSVTNGSLGNFTVQLTRGPLNLTEPSFGSSNPTSPPPTTTAPPTTTPTPPLIINRDGCGTNKLCLETPDICDPAGNDMCLFTSIVVGNPMPPNGIDLRIELRGDSDGYIALGLTSSATPDTAMVFICAQNSSNNGSFFFNTLQRNNSNPNAGLTPLNRNVTNIRGEVKSNVIRCIFTVRNINSTRTKNADTTFSAFVGSGSVNGSSFGLLTVALNRSSLNLANPALGSSNPTSPPPTTPAPTPVIINRDGCGTNKLCLEIPGNCDPAGSDMCLFTSFVVRNLMPPNGINLNIELRGDSNGYIALGLTSSATPDTAMVFICAQNSSNNGSFFFNTLQRNNSNPNAGFTPLNRNVTNIRGEVKGNVIRCIFTVPNINSTRTKNADTTFSAFVGSGSVNGSSFGLLTVALNRSSLNLANPALGSSNPTSPPPTTPAPTPVIINRDGCGTNKLCLEIPGNCDPAGSDMCLFTSFVVRNLMPRNSINLNIELRGDSNGYIALGLTSSATPDTAMVFICAQNSSNNGSFFFNTVQRNNSNPNAGFTPLNRNVTNIRGEVKGNVIRCIFTVPNINSTRTRNADTTFSAFVGSGSVNGSSFGLLTVALNRSSLNLANPALGSSNPTPTTQAPTSVTTQAPTNATTQAPTATTCDAASSYPHALLLLSALVLSVMMRN